MVKLPFSSSCIALILSLQFLIGCSTNPVTGENELILLPESMEIQMGEENYMPARQMQGGDYVVHPEVVEYMREVGRRLAAVSDRKLPYEFTVVNDPEINAWMMPGGKMAVNRGLLLKIDSEAELAAVMGHEIVHAAARHGAHQLEQGLLLEGVVLAAALAIEANTDKEWVRTVGILGARMAETLVSAKFSRDDEREADHYGMVYMVRAGYDPRAAISVQKMLMREGNGGNDLVTRLLSDHPVSEERVALAEQYAARVPQGGEWGRERYQRKLAALFKDAPAYEKYQEASKAYAGNDLGKAKALVDEAIRMQPREALFHLLKGDIYRQGYEEQRALAEYRKAAKLNPGYYQPHLKLGVLLDSMGRKSQARVALENSARLLKTAAALRRLGDYWLENGEANRAKALYKEAAGSDSTESRIALRKLLQLDLPQNAGEYLSASLSSRPDGTVLLTVTNDTPFPVQEVVVEVVGDGDSQRIQFNDVLLANSSRSYGSSRKIPPDRLQGMNVEVISARLAVNGRVSW